MSGPLSSTCQNPSVERLWRELAPARTTRPEGGLTLAEVGATWGVGRTVAERRIAELLATGKMREVEGVDYINGHKRRARFYVPQSTAQSQAEAAATQTR
jgi:hypothetical protein